MMQELELIKPMEVVVMSNLDRKKDGKLKDLRKKEKLYFDTYKNVRDDKGKVKHLREMADVIEQIINLNQ
jgi:hypothetical protein